MEIRHILEKVIGEGRAGMSPIFSRGEGVFVTPLTV